MRPGRACANAPNLTRRYRAADPICALREMAEVGLASSYQWAEVTTMTTMTTTTTTEPTTDAANQAPAAVPTTGGDDMTTDTTTETSPETARSPGSEPTAPKAKPKNGGNGYPFPTKREILAQLATDRDFRVTSLLVLYRRQTEDEQETKETKYKNRRGFMSSHAVNGTRIAQAILAGEELSEEDEAKLDAIVPRYSKQLAAHARQEALAADPSKADTAAVFFGG